MADIRDWEAFQKGRWNWTSAGYEDGFPRGCQFSDIDAVCEFNGNMLFIEAKAYDVGGVLGFDPPFCELSHGQRRLLERLARLENTTVLVLHGLAGDNEPYGIDDIGARVRHDMRGDSVIERRRMLKRLMDSALGVA